MHKCPAALTFAARSWASSLNPEELLTDHKGARGRRPGPPPRSVTRSRATAPREGAAGRRTVRRRGIRHDVQAPLRRASGKPALLWASSCPLFWEWVGPKGRPCWLGLPAGCRRQEATSILRGQHNPGRPWWGRRQLASGSSLPHAGRALESPASSGPICAMTESLCLSRGCPRSAQGGRCAQPGLT